MKTLILAAAGVLALATTANAQTVIKENEAGVHSAPVAGATPQAREHPADDTTVLETHEKTTVVEPREKTIVVVPREEPREKVVIEKREAPAAVEVERGGAASPY